MRVLVTGGNRYIGRHLVEELARRGHEVTVFNSHPSPLPEGVRRVHGDRKVPGVIEQVLGPLRDDFDAVFDNTSYQTTDVEPLVELFRGRVKHYVFTSSTAVYLWSDVQPVTEEFPVSDDDAVNPARAYGGGKVRCERLLQAEYERSGFPATSLRVGHTLGPHSPLPTRDPGFFARLEAGRPILMPGDGMAAVHLVHIDDVAAAMCAVIETEASVGQVYNINGAEFAGMAAYVRLMAEAVGVEAKLVHIPRDIAKAIRPPVIHWAEWYRGGMVFSIEKAKRELGWAPKFGLRRGLADSYAWFREEGRDTYEFDFSHDDAVLKMLEEKGIA
ncbi:MAG: NAD-dependent epimerase/dehydratase family protein [Dehalococcoidia bacterium]|nr:NAD-dependent epimerase/dehydratase family protein [Dehalococcoidia bacterium]